MRLSIHLAAIAATLGSFVSQALPAQTPTKEAALGVFPFLNGNMDGQINTVVNDAVTRGLDIIYCSAFRTTGLLTGELWITDSAGTWNTALGAVRPGGAGINLRSLIQAAHARNIQVVAVIKCFESDAPPSNAAHKAYVLDVVRYLVNSYDSAGAPIYDLDGLALDYVRWVGGGSGIDATQVTNFCRDVKSICGALSLHAYLVAGRFDFDGPTYDANFNSYTSVINANASGYGQHWEQMARHVDVLMPMAYTADGSIYNTAARHQAYVAKTAEYARTACTRAGVQRRVQPTIKTYTSTGETTTPTTIDASIRGALQFGDGFQLFRWGTIANQPSWWTAVQAWAVPGQNWPLPVFNSTGLGLTARLDASASRDDGPAGTLSARLDLGNDGSFETGWLPIAQVYDWLLTRPGATGRVGLQVRDADGHISASQRSVRLTANVLTSLQPSLSASAGGSVRLDLDVGPGGAGVGYALLGGLSGAVPGTTLAPGFVVPVNFDGISSALLSLINTPVFVNAMGTLDANGRAQATFNMPPGILTPVILRTFTWGGFGTLDGAPKFVTNAWSTTIVP